MHPFSLRFKRPSTLERLRHLAAQRSEPVATTAERLIDEGLRMEAHPGVVFRPGPTGRRAGIVAGPDVWEVVAVLRSRRGSLEHRVAKVAEQLGLTPTQVRVASRYYAEFPEEIDQQIAANEEAAERELQGWEAERRLLSG